MREGANERQGRSPFASLVERGGPGRLLVVALAALAFAGLVLLISALGIGDGAYDLAALILLAAGAVVLLPFSVSLSFTYTCAIFPAVIALNRHAGVWGPGRVTFYLLLLLFLAVAALSWVRAPGRRTHVGAAGWAVLALVLYLLVAALAAEDRHSAIATWINHSYHWPFLVLPSLLLRSQAQVRLLVWTIAGLATVLALASIVVTFLVTDPSAILAHGGQYQRVHLYFGTANSLGLFLAIGLFVLLYGLRFEARWPRWAKTLAQILIMVAILLTFSRRTWLATGALLLFHYLWRRDWRGVVLIALAAAALGYQMREQIGERAETMVNPEHASNIERQREVTEHLDHLFGDGISAFGWGMDMGVGAAEADMSRELYFHNYYLTLYYLSGAAGLALFVLVALSVLVALRRVQRPPRGPTAPSLASAALAVLAVVLVTGMFGNANITFPVNYFSALVPGLAFAAAALDARDEPGPGP